MDKRLRRLEFHKTSLIDMEYCRKTAVSVPLIEKSGEYEVLFEVRAKNIEQPGDVCFPGGGLEGDETPREAAIREAAEELLINPSQLKIIGLMDVIYNPSGMLIYPFAAELKDYEGSFSKDEVDEVFTVPLSFFLENEPEVYIVKAKVIPGDDFPYELIYGGEDYDWRPRKEVIYFYRYGERVIWGLTAKIIRSFAKIYKAEVLE